MLLAGRVDTFEGFSPGFIDLGGKDQTEKSNSGNLTPPLKFRLENLKARYCTY
jgi:hypothetical protein